MKHFFLGLAVAVAVTTSAFAQTQSYTGNGSTGFGGTMGNSTLDITASGSTLDFSYTTAGAIGNVSVFYIDSVAGGFTDTSMFSDSADGGRRATSGFNSGGPTRTLATFASGFAADYAIAVGPGFAVAFTLAAGGDNSFGFTNPSVPFANPSGTQYTFSFNFADFGLSPGQSFNFIGTLISDSAYRSNETIGTSSTVPGTGNDAPNAGFAGTTTFSDFKTFAIPEPSTFALLIGGALVSVGSFLKRRRS